MQRVKIGITGAAGRMGLTVARTVAATPGCALVAGCERAGMRAVSKDLGELAGLGPTSIIVGSEPAPVFAAADAVIDFTTPAALAIHADLAARTRTAYIVGTTGLGEAEFAALRQAARQSAIVQAYNMSLGVNLLAALVRRVAEVLDDDFDIEIVEMHHRMKVDAPSGTALMFGEAAAKGRGYRLGDIADRGRDGTTGPRQRGHIGFASLRGGNVVGEHSVIFAADDERIELGHKATDRGVFARGAVRAARWAQGKPPGLYTMADVLGLAAK